MKRFYLSSIVLLIALLSGFGGVSFAQTTTTFSYTGAMQTYTVPAGCLAIQVDVAGAQGGSGSWSNGTGGKGGRVQAVIAVTGGQVLNIFVGQQPPSSGCGSGGAAGGNSGGGGQGGVGSSYYGQCGGAGGGGATDIRTGGAAALNTRLVVGGAGGGSGYNCGEAGGDAGGATGANGNSCGSYSSGNNGTPGTQTGGGTGGANPGGLGFGGNCNSTTWCAGGGGGYYGSAGAIYGSACGGSSYPVSGPTCTAGPGTGIVTNITNTGGYQSGNGYALITPLVPTVTATPSPLAFGPVMVGTTSIPKYTVLSGLYMATTTLTLNITGANPSAFSFETDATAAPVGSGWTVGGSGSQTMTITTPTFSGANVYVNFTPPGLGSYTANLSITGGGLAAAILVPLTGTGVNSCAGTPSTPLCVASPSSGGLYSSFTLSMTPAFTDGGYSYQWQSSPTGSAPWTNISGAVLSTYSFTGLSATTYYQCIITCNASGLSTTATPAVVTFAGMATNGCSSPTTTNPYSSGFSIGMPSPYQFIVNGAGTSSITDGFVISGTAVYHDFSPSLNVTCAPGGAYTAAFAGNTALQASSMNIQFWVDFNNDGTFQTTEAIGGGTSVGGARTTVPYTIPANALPGVYRMRVVLDYATGNPAYPSIPPCPPAGSALTYGDIRDYTMIIGPPACAGAQEPGITASTANSACQPLTFTPTIVNIGQSNQTGVTYNWQSSPTIGGAYTNIGGAVNAVYTPTITTAGVVCYRNSVGCGGTYTYSAPTCVSLNPAPTPITPTPANLCTGVPSTLVSTPSGGTWTSANTAVATTAGSLSGAITGVAVGVTNITYTLPTGCFASTTVTVNSQPPAFTAMPPMCVGQTMTLTDAFTGGTWTSSTITVATIGAFSGTLTAVAPGTTLITYASTFGCTVSSVLTVNALPTLFIVSPGTGYSYCTGSASTGHVTLSGSTVGVTYQLLLGGSPTGLPSMAGTGSPLDFGIQSAPGVYTVLATNNTTGCSRQMVGSSTFTIFPLPIVYNVYGGGSYCSGSTGSAPHIFLSGSQVGVNYKLQLSGTTVVTVAGTGGTLDFGPQTLAGCYTVLGQNGGSGCQNPMSGSACVTINSLPTAFHVLPPGGGSFCTGGSGIDIQLDFSNTGITYTLFNGGTTVSTLSGTGGLLDFGMISTPGTYTVTGRNVTTTCTASMAGAATITVNTPPTQYNVQTTTGGNSGSFCAGGAGVDIWLAASDGGVNYQLYLGTTPIGTPQGGTGLPLEFGNQILPGVYTVVATNSSTLCSSTMLGSVTITINPLPPLCIVTGGGNFCVGGTGVPIGLNPSTLGISYQLMMGGATVGSPIIGTGSAINFGIFNTVGIYSVVATNTVTGCTVTMSGVATISTNPLPTSFNVTGGGSYCSGSTGTAVGLDFSATGITYQLYRTGVAVGTPVSGTGGAITFGIETLAGTYTVVGTNVSTSCTGNMSGSAIVSINSSPNLHLVIGGGNFCAGDTGAHVGVNTTETGINYQLLLGTTPVGSPLAGTGSLIDFGLQTTGGTYTVVAINSATGCSRYMSGGVPINVYALPASYTVTGGGLYCAGSTGVHIGLSGSASGIRYQLYLGSSPTGLPVSGTGTSVDFGIQIAPGTYSVVGVNSGTGCMSNMISSVNVGINPLPSVYTVSGGGNYCTGGTGSSISLSGSDVSVDYQLYHGTTAVGAPVAGTGTLLSYGPLTGTGSYTIRAVNSATGCSNTMAGSASIGINSLPTAYTVSGGGNYCAGGAGEHIFLAGSVTGVSYQLYNDTVMVGTAMAGTGGGIDFGALTAAGTYKVIATNTSTTCMNNMSGSAAISILPLPAVHAVTGGGSYCIGGSGVNIGLDGSNPGMLYQLYQGGVSTGVAIPGTGSNLNFGLHTAPASYTVVAVNNSTLCASNMTGSATVAVNPLPATYNVTGGGSYCATGLGVHVYLSGSNSGVNYQLWNGTTMIGTATAGTGSTLDFGLLTAGGAYSVTALNPTTTCTNNMVGSVSVSILPVLLPSATLTSSITTGLVCVGQTVNFSAAPVNGGSAPTFRWMVNGTSVGVSGTTFSYIPVNGDIVTAQITSNYQCAIPDTGSGSMTMNVSPPEMPSVSVSVNPGTEICTGGTASFTATTSYGGPTPNLRWIKNSTFVGTGSTYSYVPNNGDIVTFMLGSDFPCRLADTVFSANTTLVVSNPVLPVVTISTNPGTNITTGQTVTFTANVVHGGSSPAYQWVVNSTEVPGATNSTWTTSNLNNKDSVSCMVNGTCGLVGFNSVGITVHGAGVGFTNVTGKGSNVTLVPNPNKGDFTVKGTLASNLDQEATLEVVDMIGQVIYTNKVMAQGGNINEHVKLNNLANGMYLLNMRTGDESVVFHFVIEQ